MTPDAPFRREHVVDVDAAVVGISRERWFSVTPSEAQDLEAVRSMMADDRFDVVPVAEPGEPVTEYVVTVAWGDFTEVERREIKADGTLPQRTPLDEVVRAFDERNRQHLFLTRYGRVTGLVTVSHLNCRQSRVYFYSLFSELEMALARLIGQEVAASRVTNEEVLSLVRDGVRESYEQDRERNVDADPTEYFHINDLTTVIVKLGLHKSVLDFSGNNAFTKPLNRLVKLRNRVAHPVRPLVGGRDTVRSLWRDLLVIDNLLAQLRRAAPTP